MWSTRSVRAANDDELLQIEIETIWGTDDRGRIVSPDLVIASSAAGLRAAIGAGVPDDLAVQVVETVRGATPSTELSTPPAVLEQCRMLLESALEAPVELAPGSGPSYLIQEPVAFASNTPLVRSDGRDRTSLLGANPGNWEAEEWEQLIEGQLGPWVMAIQQGVPVSICHTPATSARGAEAGVWTQPEFRGRGLAAAVTAAWAALMRPSGRYLFYSTSRTNSSSQRVAARLGLRPIGWLWQLASSRQQTSASPHRHRQFVPRSPGKTSGA